MVQLKKSFLNLSKLSISSANRKSFQSLVIVVQIESRFKVSQSLAMVVQSWKIRFKTCQSLAIEVQVEEVEVQVVSRLSSAIGIVDLKSARVYNRSAIGKVVSKSVKVSQ